MHNHTSLVTIGTILVLFALLDFPAVAQLSTNVINYQGKLSDSTGPMDGSAAMIFQIYDTTTPGSSSLWTEAHANVQVAGGVFNVSLGSQTAFPLNLFDTYDDLYMKVTVEGEDMAPLQHLTATPYSLKAEMAQHAHTATAADHVLNGTVTGDFLVEGSVGVGSADPLAKFHIVMPSGGTLPSLIPGMIIEDSPSSAGNRLEVRDENGVAEFFITGTGNVVVGGDGLMGLGTVMPESLLHLSSLGGVDLILEADTNNSGGEDQNARIVLRQDGGEVSARLGYRHEENDLEIMQEFNDDLFLGTNNNDRMTIKNDGKVGIGTSIPESILHIAMPRGTTMPSTVGGLVIADNNFNSGNQLEIRDEEGNERVVVDGAGQVGIGTSTPGARLDVNGRTKTDVLEITGGADLSERFEIRNMKVELFPTPGMVVSIDPESPGSLMVSNSPYDKKVAGIISGAGGVNPGMIMGQENSVADGDNPVALTGRVYCSVDASNGAISPGDFLTTSHTPGYAMKVKDFQKAQGAIIGKAMTELERGQGLVLVLVTLQ